VKKIGQIQLVSTALTLFSLWLLPMIAYSQDALPVQCGDAIDGVFTDDNQIHQYQINLEEDTMIYLYAEETGGNYQNLVLDIGLVAPNGHIIDEIYTGCDYYGWCDGLLHETDWSSTSFLSEVGVYDINVIGFTETGSPYTFYVSCISMNGNVNSNNDFVQGVTCGSDINNEFNRDNQYHIYFLYLESGDSVNISAISTAGNYQTLVLDLGLRTPTGHIIDEIYTGCDYYDWCDGLLGSTSSIETEPVSESGVYRILVHGFTSTSSPYNFTVGCTLRDGTVIRPGDAPRVEPPSQTISNPNLPSFSGFGFPGIMSVDFSNAIEIPISDGQSQTSAFGSSGQDVFAYIYEASAGSSATLSVSRISGDISIGVAVINQADNSVLYLGGMPSSDNLSIELEFPSAGTYVIGVFRLDIAHTGQTGTSGAVEVRLNRTFP
jgi:hypothetical protein